MWQPGSGVGPADHPGDGMTVQGPAVLAGTSQHDLSAPTRRNLNMPPAHVADAKCVDRPARPELAIWPLVP